MPWAGSGAKRKAVSWLPTSNTRVLNDDGTLTKPWYQFFREIADTRLGGIDAQTVPQVAAVQASTQAQVLDTTNLAIQTVTNINQVASAVNTTSQVTKSAALPGASQIPTLPTYTYKRKTIHVAEGE